LFHRSFVIVEFNLVVDPERLAPKQQDSSEKVLQNVLKSKADGHAANAQDLDQIACLKRRGENSQANKNAEQQDDRTRQASKNNAQVMPTPVVGDPIDSQARHDA